MGSEQGDNRDQGQRTLGDEMASNGTPTFVVDKVMLRGYVPLQGMQRGGGRPAQGLGPGPRRARDHLTGLAASISYAFFSTSSTM